jgi:very-short-patch-repair endonuclease
MDKNQIFISKSVKIHGYKYDYSKVNYINNITPVLIGYDGIFYEVTPSNHLKGSKIEKAKTKYDLELFIKKSNEIHNYKYDYSETNFTILKSKVIIRCEKHGDFNQIAIEHLNGHGCPKCGKESMSSKVRKNSSDILDLIKNRHGDKFTYLNLTNDIRLNDIIEIICPLHGEFKQKVIYHIKHDCKKCSYIKEYDDNLTIKFINNSKSLYNNYYSYEKTIYIKNSKKCIVTCPKHGDFDIKPNSHLSGVGCRKCGYDNRKHHNKLSQEEFISKCSLKHNNLYNYNKVLYKNTRSYITIICEKHGDFEQLAGSHLYGSGCPICCESKGSIVIRSFLNNKNINFISEYKFDDCVNKLPLPFDFYLTDMNICIEFDGIQHYKPNEFFNKKISFEYRIKNDNIKNNYCLDNNIKLLRIPYWEIDNIENILKNELKL